MEPPKPINSFFAITCGIAFGAASFWFIQTVMEKVREHDENPARANIKNQLMRRKASSMDDALAAIIRGSLPQVHAAARSMKDSARTIDGFIRSEAYQNHGKEFYQAIDDLLDATTANNLDRSKEAILRLEKSCIECHYLINRRQTGEVAREPASEPAPESNDP